MNRRVGARTGLLLFELACVMIVLAPSISRAAMHTYHGKTMWVGVVLPEGCLPNHICTGSLVTNPDEIARTPGVVVRKVRVPDHKDSHRHATLRGEVVSTDLAEREPADESFTFTMPGTGTATALSFGVALAEQPDETLHLQIDQPAPSRAKAPPEPPTMAPVVPDNGVCVVHDKFTGNGHATKIGVNGTDVPALAESQSLLAFAPESALRSGENEITVTNGGWTKTYKAWDPEVTIDADKTTLEEKESTRFRVKLNLGVLPASYWATPGTSWRGASKGGGAVPAAGGAVMLLTIKNDSETTASISGGDQITVPLHQSDLVDGVYTYEGTINAKEPGPFEIEAAIDSHLVEAQPIDIAEAPGGVIAHNAPIGCCYYWNPAWGSWCRDETEGECLGRWYEGDECSPKSHLCRGRRYSRAEEGTRLSQEKIAEGGIGGQGGQVGMPMPTPQPVAPPPPELVEPKSPNATPVLHGSGEGHDCPQREKKLGCAALVIDLIQVDQDDNEERTNDREQEQKALKEVVKNLQNAKCDVDEIFAKFEKVDQVKVKPVKRETINGRTNRPIVQVELKDSSKETKNAEKHNLAEWKKINAKIEDHRKKVSAGKEIAIEIVNAHGSQGAPDKKSTCGNWSPGTEYGYYTPQEQSLTKPDTDYEEPLYALWRDEFHEGNYQAAHGNVCDWIVFDFSCYSGLTPKAIDEIENNDAPLTCMRPSIVNCGVHAGWESDTGFGVSTCAKKSTVQQTKDSLDELNENIGGGASSVEDLYQRFSKFGDIRKNRDATLKGGGVEVGESFYMDRGYKKDPDPKPPPEHPHGGY